MSRRVPVHLALALVAFVALGWHDGVLGVVWPEARQSLDRPVSSLGILLVALTVTYVLVTLGAGRAARRFGTGRLLVLAEVTAVAGAALAAWSPSWLALVLAVAVIGVSAGLVDAGLNAYVAIHHGVRPMALLHAGFGVGAASSPLLVAWLLVSGGSWRVAYVGLALGHAVVALVALRCAGSFRAAPPEEAAAPVVLARRRTAVVVAVVLFTLYVGVELTAGQWAYTLFTEGRGLSRGAAAGLVTAYWGALGAGRFLMGIVGDRLRAVSVLQTAMATAVAAALVLWWDPLGAGGAALPVLGLALAPIFPVLVSLTPGRLGAERATGIIGAQLAAAAVGGAFIPAVGGVLAEAHGLEVLAPYLVVAALIMVLTFGILERLAPASPYAPVMAPRPGEVFAFIARSSKRIAISVVGGALVAAGLAMLVLPGPGILVVALGFAVLGTEYAWAAAALERTKRAADHVGRAARRRAAGAVRAARRSKHQA